MSDQNRQAPSGQPERADAAKTGRGRTGPEGDVRQRDRQDLRTSGATGGGRSKDDPSRAPESGTP